MSCLGSAAVGSLLLFGFVYLIGSIYKLLSARLLKPFLVLTVESSSPLILKVWLLVLCLTDRHRSMGRPKSAAEALRLGCERSSMKNSNIVNSEIVLKTLQPGVQRNYDKMVQKWLAWVLPYSHSYYLGERLANSRENISYQAQQKEENPRDPEPSPYDLISLKDFIRKVAYGIDGVEGIDVPGSETVRKTWNNFTAAFQRLHPENPIPRGIASSVTQV